MVSTTEFDIRKIKEDILNRLRYTLNSSDPKSRVTEIVSPFTYSASTTFSLSSTKLSYVKSVSVNGTPLTPFTEYTINWSGVNIGSVTILSSLTGGDSISITWGRVDGNSNFIYPDWPLDTLSQSSYPRVGFRTTVSQENAGTGGGSHYGIYHNILIQIKIVDIDRVFIETIGKEISTYIKTNAKNFSFFRWIQPNSMSEYDNFNDNTKNTFSKMLEFEIPQKLERVEFA